MLETVKQILENAITDTNSPVVLKNIMKDVIDRITAYLQEDSVSTDIHSTFRALERYSTLYKVNVQKYMAFSLTTPLTDRIFLAQEILCILSMALCTIGEVIRKYDSSKDKGTLAKYLRMLNEEKDMYKTEKISWMNTQKALTTLLSDSIQASKMEYLERTGAVDKEEA